MKTIQLQMIHLPILIFIFLAAANVKASDSTSKILMDFSEESSGQKWITVNDNVMGGISEGNFKITPNKTLLFSGNLSLENQGGFSSIRTRSTDFNIDGLDTFHLRLNGDGRTYYFNLMTSSPRSASSYRAAIKTEKDIWQEVRIPIKEFVYTTYGRTIPGVAPIQAKDIRTLGFTLADKNAGPFQLKVDWIKAEKMSENNHDTGQAKKQENNMDIVDTAIASGNFKTLVEAVKAAGLVDTLKGEGPFTVFAPTDEAFAKLPKDTIEELLKPQNRQKLISILSYHVLDGRFQLRSRSPKTLNGQTLKVISNGTFNVNGAAVIESDISTSNGVIHVIDSVMLPPDDDIDTKQAAKNLIELAIERGVPLFNAGQTSACTAIYEIAINSMLTLHADAFYQDNRSTLEQSLRQISTLKDNPSQQAWILRRALDTVYKSLSEK